PSKVRLQSVHPLPEHRARGRNLRFLRDGIRRHRRATRSLWLRILRWTTPPQERHRDRGSIRRSSLRSPDESAAIAKCRSTHDRFLPGALWPVNFSQILALAASEVSIWPLLQQPVRLTARR